MREMEVESWKRETQVPVELLQSIHMLNLRFLEILAATSGTWGSGRGLCEAMAIRIGALSAAQRRAAGTCPYVLFDLRFHDDVHWHSRLRAGAGRVADSAPVGAETLEFARLAIFFAWHAANTAGFAAPLLLGMHPSTVVDFHCASIDCLPALAIAEAANLSARWNTSAAFWGALISAAADSHASRLKRVQLYGLQLATASRLPRSIDEV